MPLVFVYGTLMSGMERDISLCVPHCEFVCEDTVFGELFFHDAGKYPAFREALFYRGYWVPGEVYYVPDAALTDTLDVIERRPWLFDRDILTTDKGIEAWVYIYKQPIAGLQTIHDWRAYAKII